MHKWTVTAVSAGTSERFEFEADADSPAEAVHQAHHYLNELDGWDVPPPDDGDDPQDGDGYVTLDHGRWYVILGGFQPDGQPGHGYPDIRIATYELAKLMAEHGDFPAAWAEGEHGPTVREISDEVRAFHNEGGDQLKPLEGVRYADGAAVMYEGHVWEVRRDYGTGLGVLLCDYEAWDTLVAHDRLTPVPEPPRYLARFTPEAWVRDQATEVDPQGEQEWDCTACVTGEPGSDGRRRLEYLDSQDRRARANGEPGLDSPLGVLDTDDVFRDDPAAPQWVRDWRGPFTIRIRINRD